MEYDMTFLKYVELNEALKIVKKNWTTDFPNYKVDYNDNNKHELISRIQDRTDLPLNKIKQKLDKGIQYIINKNEKKFFRNKTSVAITFKKSNFVAIFIINPQEKYIRLNSILSTDMKLTGTIRWDLSENLD
jgi:hypothetical protein